MIISKTELLSKFTCKYAKESSGKKETDFRGSWLSVAFLSASVACLSAAEAALPAGLYNF